MTKPSTQGAPAHPSRRFFRFQRASVIVTLALPAVMLLIGGFNRRWLSDDGFINVRVAHQLLAGNGFVFNAGERSEAVTSPLWSCSCGVRGG